MCGKPEFPHSGIATLEMRQDRVDWPQAMGVRETRAGAACRIAGYHGKPLRESFPHELAAGIVALGLKGRLACAGRARLLGPGHMRR